MEWFDPAAVGMPPGDISEARQSTRGGGAPVHTRRREAPGGGRAVFSGDLYIFFGVHGWAWVGFRLGVSVLPSIILPWHLQT